MTDSAPATRENERLVYNKNHSGGRAVTALRGGFARLRWTQPVLAMPADSAGDCVRLGGMSYAETVAECAKRTGTTQKAVSALAKSGKVHAEEHGTKDGKTVTVIVLDQQTHRALEAAADMKES